MLRDLRRQVRREKLGLPPVDVARDPANQGPVPVPTVPTVHAVGEPAHALDAALHAAIARAEVHYPVFAASLRRLDAWQLQAVVSDAPATVVRAQVGSGKTAVLAHRVLWWHLLGGIPLQQMMVATFTTKAARELTSRVADLLPIPPTDEQFWLFGTLHGVARALLHRAMDLGATGWRRGFGVLDEHERLARLQALVATHGLAVKYPAQLVDRLRLWQRTGQVRRGAMREDDELPQLANQYLASKHADNVMDFDDLIDVAAQQAAAGLSVPLTALVIDELQDCAPTEVQLLSRLRQPGQHFFAVGDPNQSIYAWRGSDEQVFATLTETFAARVLELPNNYRSSPEILAAARGVLGNKATGGALTATRAQGGQVVVRHHHDPHLEALYLAQRLQQLHDAGTPWHQLAVLARTRKQIDGLRTILTERAIPCVQPPAQTWAAQPAALWWLRVLAAATQDDVFALREALLAKDYGLLPTRLWTKAQLKRVDLVAAPSQLVAAATDLRNRAQRATGTDRRDLLDIAQWLDALDGLRTWQPQGDTESALAALLAQLRVVERLRPTHRDHQRDLAQTTRALRQVVRNLQATQTGTDAQLGFYAAQMLQGGPPQDDDGQQEGVHLLTLHASKGLEFQYVFISGCNQGVMPLASAYGDPAELAEERRLLFVGLTRARDQLEISWHTRPALPQAQPMPSEWLLAMPAAVSTWIQGGAVDQPARTATAQPSSTAPMPELTVPAAALPFAVGQAVRHPKYGVGQVTSCTADAVTAQFGKLGEKSFALLLCPLQATEARPT